MALLPAPEAGSGASYTAGHARRAWAAATSSTQPEKFAARHADIAGLSTYLAVEGGGGVLG
jgi:hypothetical protein